MSPSEKESLPKIVYDYWDDLDVIVEVPMEKENKISKKALRNQIIRAISRGVTDQDGTSKRIRHALTVNEIQDIIESMTGEKVKKSNLYYHIQVLIDLDIIQEVTTIKQGNIITSYFGRTSKLIMSNFQSKIEEYPQKYLEDDESFRTLLRRMQKKSGSEIDIDELLHDMRDIRQELVQKVTGFKSWISSYSKELRGLDLDLIKLFNLYKDVRNQSNELNSIYDNLDKIMRIR